MKHSAVSGQRSAFSTQLIAYVIIMGYLFALLDWKIIAFTRLENRDWLEWMHAHEREYATITGVTELIVCAPALALKPIFTESMKRVEVSQEEQSAISHQPSGEPSISLSGFYHLPKRGESWTFVPWLAWLAYWLPPSLIWLGLARRFFRWL